MTTFVLLHGAFHGAWCWARVAPILRAAGHTVHTPTQTGLGDRAHLRHPAQTIDGFVDDLLATLETEELTDAVLVGHSFGGFAISGAADRMPHRIRHLVYLDAVIPRPGHSSVSSSTPEIAAQRRAAAAASGTNTVAPPDPAAMGVPPGPDADWLARRMTPHPFGTMDSVLTLRHPLGNGIPATYVACTDPLYPGLQWARDIARDLVRDRTDWTWREIATGHDCMVTAPRATATLLMEIAP